MQKQEDYFKLHPKVDEFHFTKDGQAFFNEHEAKAHATSLEDKTVETVTRDQVQNKIATEKKPKNEVEVDTAKKEMAAGSDEIAIGKAVVETDKITNSDNLKAEVSTK